MAFDIDMAYASVAGSKALNDDFGGVMLAPAGQSAMGSIIAIADGVSTGGLGWEAAQTTVVSLLNDYYATPQTWDTSVALDRIIAAQNAWLAALNRRRQPEMGLTTLTAMVLRGHGYTLAHVGDSRAWLLRDGQFTQLTQDHVAPHPDLKHQLLRCIGLQDHVVVDYSQGDLRLGDVLLLTSDGVHRTLSAARIQALLQAHLRGEPAAPMQALCEALLREALARGSQDNATALAVHVVGLDHSTLHDQQRLALEGRIAPRLRLGDRLDGLQVTALVVDNGVHLLYQVRDPATRRLYALKTLSPQRAHDPQERAMLAHEAWLARRLADSRAAAHLVKLHDAAPTLGDAAASAYYLLYDWHEGQTWQQRIDRKARPAVAEAVTMAVQAASALAQLHRQGVIHRDITPANLHLGDDGVLRVLDLGVALSANQGASVRALHAGTPSFINPEQWGFRLRTSGADFGAPPAPADCGSDLFALGVALYQLLTGKLPYGEVLPYQAGRYRRDALAPSRHCPAVPIWLDHVILKAISREQRQRFETAEELLLALQRGAARPLAPPQALPWLQSDPRALWQLLLTASVLLNLLLLVWLLFLPR